MKIGIFDSGLGGLIVAKSIVRALPEYDYVYLGDTKRVPYGNRSYDVILEFAREAVEYLFNKEKCGIIIVACNTVSARALRELQKEYTPSPSGHSPLAEGRERKILGVLIPAAEEAAKFERVGVLGTRGTVASNTFPTEIKKLNSRVQVFQNSAPMLVTLAEELEIEKAVPFIKEYLKPLLNKKLDALVLGCTHYPIFKKEFRKILFLGHRPTGEAKNIKLISQDEIVPKKLKKYLEKHTEIKNKLSKGNTTKILVTDLTDSVKNLTKKWFGKNTKARLIHLTRPSVTLS